MPQKPGYEELIKKIGRLESQVAQGKKTIKRLKEENQGLGEALGRSREGFFQGHDKKTKKDSGEEQILRGTGSNDRAWEINAALFRISNAVNTTYDLDDLYKSIHQTLATIIDVSNFFIAIYDIQNRTVFFPYFVDEKDELFTSHHVDFESTSLTGEVILRRKPVFLNTEELLERASKKKVMGRVPLVWLGVPLTIRGEVIGVMAVQSYRDPALFDAKDLDVLSSVSEQVAIAIERKRAEEALRGSQQRLQVIFNTMDDFLFIFNDQGRILHVNPVVPKRLGYALSDLLSMSIHELYPSYKREEVENFLRDTHAGKRYALSLPLLQVGGTQIPIETVATLLEWDEHPAILWISRDITNRLKAGEALRQSERRFREMSDLLPTIICEMTTDLEISYMNRIGLETFSLSDAESRKALWTTEIALPEDREMLKGHLLRVSREGKPGILECRFLGRGGRDLVALVHSSPMIRDDKCHGIRMSITDITQRKNLETQLLHAQTMEVVGTLAGGIAHDFNNLLSSIIGGITLTQDHLRPGDEAQAILRIAEKSAHQARELVKKFISLSKGEQPSRKRLDVLGLVIGATRNSFADAPVKCDISIPAELWHVDADEKQIMQVIENVAINAREAMPQGGMVRVWAENYLVASDDVNPDLPARPGRYVRIGIQDQGIGISKGHLPLIFNPYFSTKERGVQKGMGLGLTVAYSIIKKHDGYIFVQSTLGEGTTFHIYLPASDDLAKDTYGKNVFFPLGGSTLPSLGAVAEAQDREMLS